MAAVAAVFSGAALGAVFVIRFGVSAAIALALFLLAGAGIAARRSSASYAAWRSSSPERPCERTLGQRGPRVGFTGAFVTGSSIDRNCNPQERRRN